MLLDQFLKVQNISNAFEIIYNLVCAGFTNNVMYFCLFDCLFFWQESISLAKEPERICNPQNIL